MIAPRANKYLIWFCLFPALAGLVALASWTILQGKVQSLPPLLIQMNPMTAICFNLLAAVLWLRANPGEARRQRISATLAVVVAVIGRSQAKFLPASI